MSYPRTKRISEEIKKIVSKLILQDIKDPRVTSLISVVDVDVTADLKYAYIYVSIFSNEKATALEGLKNASGFIRREVGKQVKLRYTPEIIFKLDESIEKGVYMSELIQKLQEEKKMSQINDVIDVIRRSDNIVITSHYSPDGDSIGSSVALYHMFKNICKNVYIVLDDKIPMNLQFLCNNISINKSEDLNIEDYTLVCVDCGDFSRLSCSDQIKQNSKIIVNIDHHASNNKFGNVNYIDENASSTCELVYNLVYKLDKKLLDKDIAQCLYTGLITDTGNFMYSNTHSSSFKMAADLLSLNIDKQRIIENIYQSNPLNLIKLIGEAIGTIEVINKTVACIEVTRELMDKYEIDFNDVDGIVNYARDINGVELAILFKEKSDSEIKISFRSKSYIDVNRIASKFKGGGHKRASGCTMNMSLKDAKSKIISEVLKHI